GRCSFAMAPCSAHASSRERLVLMPRSGAKIGPAFNAVADGLRTGEEDTQEKMRLPSEDRNGRGASVPFPCRPLTTQRRLRPAPFAAFTDWWSTYAADGKHAGPIGSKLL